MPPLSDHTSPDPAPPTQALRVESAEELLPSLIELLGSKPIVSIGVINDSALRFLAEKANARASDHAAIPPKPGLLIAGAQDPECGEAVLAEIVRLDVDLAVLEFRSGSHKAARPSLWPFTILKPQGFSNFAVIKRRKDFAAIQINSPLLDCGDSGYAIFIHDRISAAVLPLAFEASASTQDALLSQALNHKAESERRLKSMKELSVSGHFFAPPIFKRLAQYTARERYFLQKNLVEFLLKKRWIQVGSLRLKAPKKMQLETFPEPTQPVSAWPSIAIVTPSYMQGRFLERTIRSVLSQKYPKLGYTVRDGGSKDESGAIIQSYASQLAGWESAPDGGQAAAIKRGFEGRTEEVMAWLNSDDLLMPGALAFVGNYFAENPAVDVIYGHRVLIDENDQEVGRWVLPAHDSEILKWADYVPQETLFWRRELWEKVGGIDPEFHFAMDWDLLLRFQDAGANMVRLPYFLGCFRAHAEQKTSSKMSIGAQEITRIRERVHGRPIDLAEASPHNTEFRVRAAKTALLLALGIRA